MHITLNQLSDNIGDSIKIFVAKAVDVTEVLAKKSIQKNFDVEGRPAWKPSRKKKKYPRAKTLTKSGALRQIQSYSVLGADSFSATITLAPGMRAPHYAAIHQLGGTINRAARTMKFRKNTAGKWRFAKNKHKKFVEKIAKKHTITMPARPFLVIPEEDLKNIIAIISSLDIAQ